MAGAKNLFKKAKDTGVTKTSKAKEEKVRVRIREASFYDKISRLETLQENLKRDKAEADMIADEVKETGKAEWSKIYDKTGRNPGSIMLESKMGLNTAQFMFLPSDKYITVNEDRAKDLSERFGESIIDEKTTFSFDNEMVDKYGEIISALIESSDDIDEEDKEKIIKAVVSFSIAKGTIDKLKSYSEEAELNVLDLYEEVKPVTAIKNVEVIKG